MTHHTPEGLPPAEFIADLTQNWDGPWARAADEIIEALRAQAASVEPRIDMQVLLARLKPGHGLPLSGYAPRPTPEPAQAVDAAETEFCWLVEHFLGDGTGNSTGQYHTGFSDLGGNSRSTTDPLQAKRYSTWKEANAASIKLGHTLAGTWRAVQHGFAALRTSRPTQPQAQQGGGESADSGVSATGWHAALDIRTAQGWKLEGAAIPVLYTDTINGQQVCRDDVWLCTTSALAAQQPSPAPVAALTALVQVPVQILKDASEALGNFVSDHGWAASDMQAMDNLDAYIAQHAARQPTKDTP